MSQPKAPRFVKNARRGRQLLREAAELLRTAKGKYDHIDFKPPASVANAAKKGLEYRKKQKGDKAGLSTGEAAAQGIGSGVQRAVNLKNRDTMSPETVRRMKNFFSRHQKNKAIAAEFKGTPWKDKGYVAWLLWGGDPGKSWAEKVVRQMDAADEKSKKASLPMAPVMPRVRPPEVERHPQERDTTYMSRRFLRQMAVQAALLSKMVKAEMPLRDWQESKITSSAKELNSVFNSLMFGDDSPLMRVASDNEPTNPKLWSRAKAEAKKKFKKYPSAYGNGWAVQWYNKRGGGWRKKKKKGD